MSNAIQVIIDTREQTPWKLSEERFRIIKRSLDTGDYSIDGLESLFCIERKSLGDFVGTVIHDWLRFRKQLIRMSGMELAVVMVEASLDDVRGKKYESDVEPESVIGRANQIVIEHGVPVLWCGSRESATVMAERMLIQVHDKMGVARGRCS